MSKINISEFSYRLEEFQKRLNEERKKHQAERDAVKGDDIVFTVPPYEQKTLNKWLTKHKKTCSMRFDENGDPNPYPGGTAGGLLTYQFTPTGIGTAIVANCACGESINITDYGQW